MKKILSIVLAVLMLASTVAISGIVSASAATTAPVSVELIPAYGEKDLSIAYNTLQTGEGVNEISIVNTSTLTGGAEGVPSSTAYYLKNNDKKNGTGLYFEINKEIWPITREWANKEIYLEFWIWTSAKLINPVLRMFPKRENVNGRYVENACMAFGDNSKWTTVAGWSRCIIKLDSGYSNNANGGKWYYEMMNEGIFRNIEFHDHANAGADIAIAAVRLIKADSATAAQTPWGFEISSSKTHYYLNETPSKDDFTVKYQGQEVEDFTMSAIDTSTWGRKVITFTANGVSQQYNIQVKPRGNTFGDTNAELYGGKPDNGIGCALNNDNYRTGDQSMVFYGNNDTHYRTVGDEIPLDLTGEEYFEFWIYITPDFLKTASTSAEFLIELSSTRNPTANTWRYHWKTNTANYDLLQFKGGWQKVRIPLQKNLATGGDFDRTTDHFNKLVHLVQNFTEPMDFSEIDGMRIRTPNWPTDITSNGMILLGGIGYGMDVSVNNEKWGDDLATAIAEAPAGATVKLENDITTDKTIIIDKKVYLDLNRFTLKSSADPIFKIVEGGNLRVVDNNNYLRASYGGEQRYQGDIISTTAGASAFKMIGATENNGSETIKTILKVSEKIDIFADYGVDVNLDTKAEGIYTSYGVEAELYGNFAPSGLSEYNCNIYINGLVQGDPTIDIYGGNYQVTDISHFTVPGEGTINVKGGTFNGALAAGSTTTPIVKTDVYLFGNYTDNVKDLIIADGVWDIDVSAAKAIAGGYFLNDSYKEVANFELNTVDSNDADMIFEGNWTTFNNQKNANNYNMIRASKSGSTIKFNFTGSVFELAGYKSPSYGKINVHVVGFGSWVVDLYAAEATWDAHIFSAVLPEGTYDVIITVLGEKNAAATNKGLFYAALDTISVDGTVNAISDTYVAESDIVLDSANATITVDEVFTNGKEATGLTNVVSVNGNIAVEGNKIHYVADITANDTITYEMNGVKGKINVTFDQVVFEAENYLVNGTKVDAWKLSDHSAMVLEAGETATFTFTGSALTIIGYKSLKYGDFRLYIDDEYIGRISEKGEGYNYQFGLGRWTCDEGTHTVEIRAQGKVLLDGFVVE